jgi:hypothetical protein
MPDAMLKIQRQKMGWWKKTQESVTLLMCRNINKKKIKLTVYNKYNTAYTLLCGLRLTVPLKKKKVGRRTDNWTTGFKDS